MRGTFFVEGQMQFGFGFNNMRPIPIQMREQIAEDPFMRVCIYTRRDAPKHICRGRITWEHAWMYAGKQINEPWAIVPCCEAGNSGEWMDKDYNRYRALERANLDDLCQRMPKKDWRQIFNFLKSKYAIDSNDKRRDILVESGK